MKQVRKNILVFSIVFGLLLGSFIILLSFSSQNIIPTHSSGCSVFSISKGDQVFFGGNDDYITTDNYFWVDPGLAQYYGAIWIGEVGNVQQGVNEKGLAYDANGLPRIDVNPHLERKFVDDNYTIYPILIMRECATVKEVIHWVNTHQWHSYMHDQMHFADATGDAVIISAGADGEVAFTRKPEGDSFLVSTNFNVANPNNGFGYPCWRYDKATELLKQMVTSDEELTAQGAAAVLDAIHVEHSSSWTVGSMVADLTNETVYLYYFHQFDSPVVINVKEEIAAPRPGMKMSELFPEEVQREAMRRYETIQSQRDIYAVFGKIWLGFVAFSFLVFILFTVKSRKGWAFWIPTVIILGPIALLIWLIAGREQEPTRWQKILIEAVGDITPIVIGFFVVLLGLLQYPMEQSLQLLLLISIPFLIGWLFFQSLFLNLASHSGYFHTLIQRIPHNWVVTNLGVAGIFPFMLTIANLSAQIPLPPWIVIAWWGFTAVCAIISILLLSIFHRWTVDHGYQAWTILAGKAGKVSSGRWKKLWWWILISLGGLIASLLAFARIQEALQ